MNTITRTWNLNGSEVTASFPAARRLLDVLREDLKVTGTKEGCGEGECGACTVLLNGEPVLSCLMAAGQVPDGADLMTVEGLEHTDGGQTLQKSYEVKGAAQCGFCIPGMILSSYALLKNESNPSRERIQEIHAGNICRCTGYEKIIEAVEDASANWPASEQAAS
jgi:carbon-monoxide dehydrogenase small subunit